MSRRRRHLTMRLPRVRWRDLRPHSRRSAGVLGLVLLSILWCTRGDAAEAGVSCWPREQILAAIRFVESSDRDDVPDGDDGKAIGPYQIHRVYWQDACEFEAELGGNYQDCRRRDYAERVIDAYMRRHAAEAWRIGDGQTIARVHNGGPRGAEKEATLKYWRRVQDRLPGPS